MFETFTTFIFIIFIIAFARALSDVPEELELMDKAMFDVVCSFRGEDFDSVVWRDVHRYQRHWTSAASSLQFAPRSQRPNLKNLSIKFVRNVRLVYTLCALAQCSSKPEALRPHRSTALVIVSVRTSMKVAGPSQVRSKLGTNRRFKYYYIF
ncbi:hypothetical protein LENED_004825 [Lentinula edodes]|uniref:Uncharacterized protein n=1 Tax=Lentinula edodes TaxID=5353 RepID=A0A1Q3E7T7_LENED|nr:hypothetical protein LENED_004825 [Lentinula edodes]